MRLTICILLLYRKVWMTLGLSLAAFCRPNYSFAFDFLQHNVHILHRRDYDKKRQLQWCCDDACIINTGYARVRERRECISEASVSYVQVRFTIKGSLH